MRRLIAALSIFALCISYFVSAAPSFARAADQVCWVFEVVLTNIDTVVHTAFVIFVGEVHDVPLTGLKTLTLNPGQTGTLRLAAFVPAGIIPDDEGEADGLDFNSVNFGPASASA